MEACSGRSTLRGVLERVRHQVAQDALDVGRVGKRLGEVRRERRFEVVPAQRGLARETRQDPCDAVREIERHA
jgi:hypothetical protein